MKVSGIREICSETCASVLNNTNRFDYSRLLAHGADKLPYGVMNALEWLVSFSAVLGLGRIDNNNYIEPRQLLRASVLTNATSVARN